MPSIWRPVSGGADNFHAAGMGLVVGLRALETWQEGMVDIDHAAFEAAADVLAEYLHVTRKDDQLAAGFPHDLVKARFGFFLCGGRNRHMEPGQVPVGKAGFQRVMVRDDAGHVDGQLAAPRCIKQRVGAVIGFGNKQQDFHALRRRTDGPVSGEFFSDRLHPGAHSAELVTLAVHVEDEPGEEPPGLYVSERARGHDEAVMLLHQPATRVPGG